MRDTGLFVAALWVERCRLPAVPDPEVESCWSCRVLKWRVVGRAGFLAFARNSAARTRLFAGFSTFGKNQAASTRILAGFQGFCLNSAARWIKMENSKGVYPSMFGKLAGFCCYG